MTLRVLDQRRRGARFIEQRARSVINPPESTGMHFWSLNPYVGCELGCSYCYARFAHRYAMERARDRGDLAAKDLAAPASREAWEAFEKLIFVKQRHDVLAALDRDLKRITRRNERAPQTVAIGTATDPYQPAERKFVITRAVLLRLTSERGLRIGIVTKSPLVCRDVDLLRQLQSRHVLTVHLSLITVDERVVRAFETRTPMPHTRLRALRRLIESRINAGLIAAPVLPGITDSRAALTKLFRAAAHAGARFVYASPLRIYPGVRGPFLPVLEHHFPDLAARYHRAYARAVEAPDAYREALQRRVREIAERVGLPMDETLDATDDQPRQLSFWSLPTCDRGDRPAQSGARRGRHQVDSTSQPS